MDNNGPNNVNDSAITLRTLAAAFRSEARAIEKTDRLILALWERSVSDRAAGIRSEVSVPRMAEELGVSAVSIQWRIHKAEERGKKEPAQDGGAGPAVVALGDGRLGISRKDAERALGISKGTLQSWLKDPDNPVHLGEGILTRSDGATIKRLFVVADVEGFPIDTDGVRLDREALLKRVPKNPARPRR